MFGLKWIFWSLSAITLGIENVLAQPAGTDYRKNVESEDDIIDKLFVRRGPPPQEPPVDLQNDLKNLNKTLLKGEKIDFGVNHSDPRYFLKPSTLRTGINNPHGPVLSSGKEGDTEWLGRENEREEWKNTGKLQQTPSLSTENDRVNYLMEGRQGAQVPVPFVHRGQIDNEDGMSDFIFVVLMAGCTAAAVCAVIGAGICYFRVNRKKKDAADLDYPAYGVTGPSKDFSPSAADRKLAQSAHMFHYQHQKQQMLALGNGTGKEDRVASVSDAESEEGDEEGHYTVYECPGLAPTGEMEVKNPLFSDDPTPVTPPRVPRGGFREANGVPPKKDSETVDDD